MDFHFVAMGIPLWVERDQSGNISNFEPKCILHASGDEALRQSTYFGVMMKLKLLLFAAMPLYGEITDAVKQEILSFLL